MQEQLLQAGVLRAPGVVPARARRYHSDLKPSLSISTCRLCLARPLSLSLSLSIFRPPRLTSRSIFAPLPAPRALCLTLFAVSSFLVLLDLHKNERTQNKPHGRTPVVCLDVNATLRNKHGAVGIQRAARQRFVHGADRRHQPLPPQGHRPPRPESGQHLASLET